jgi:hypothetical protein
MVGIRYRPELLLSCARALSIHPHSKLGAAAYWGRQPGLAHFALYEKNFSKTT